MENSREYYCLNIVVSISSFSPFNTNANTTLKCYHNQALKKKLKLMIEGHEIFYEKATGPLKI